MKYNYKFQIFDLKSKKEKPFFTKEFETKITETKKVELYFSIGLQFIGFRGYKLYIDNKKEDSEFKIIFEFNKDHVNKINEEILTFLIPWKLIVSLLIDRCISKDQTKIKYLIESLLKYNYYDRDFAKDFPTVYQKVLDYVSTYDEDIFVQKQKINMLFPKDQIYKKIENVLEKENLYLDFVKELKKLIEEEKIVYVNKESWMEERLNKFFNQQENEILYVKNYYKEKTLGVKTIQSNLVIKDFFTLQKERINKEVNNLLTSNKNIIQKISKETITRASFWKKVLELLNKELVRILY